MNRNHSGFLTDEELEKLLEAADRRGRITEKIPLNIGPFTGLTNSELRHLRDSWIDWMPDRDVIGISIPESVPCTSIRFTDGATGITSRDEPCLVCQESSAPGSRCWSKKKRTIYVHSSRAIAQLESIFTLYDEMPATEPSTPVRNLSKEILGKTVTMTTLRNTHIRLLATRGLSIKDITARLGHKPTTVFGQAPLYIQQILRSTTDSYGNLLRPQTLFDFLKQHGPMTRKELCDHFGISTIQDPITTLESEGVIERVGKKRTHKRGRCPDLYDAIDDAKLDYSCPICAKEFDSLRGKGVHLAKVHPSEDE